MQDAWHIVKWICVAVLGVYLVVQVLAVRRLNGNLQKYSNTVLTIMVLVMGVSEAIQGIFFFENRMADRIGMLVVGFVAFVATIALIRKFAEDPVAESESDERRIESLRLN